MEMRPATIIAIVVVIIALILPVFFLNLEDPVESKGNGPDEPSANRPHPHKPSPEMQRELDRIRAENRPVVPPTPPSNGDATPPTNNLGNTPPLD
jgi:hypothetical protein